ncbi:vomeronasal type-2 receptor 26-like [Gastrophryne carolinensis]
MTLGYDVHDSCNSMRKAIQSVLQILSGPGDIVPNYSCCGHGKLAGVIGDETSERSLHIYQMLNLYGQLQISYGATDPIFYDKQMFPSFFHTLPSDQIKVLALMELLKHYNWTWIGVIVTDDYVGEKHRQEIKKMAATYDICIEFVIYIYMDIRKNNLPESMNIFIKSTSEIVVICSSSILTFSRLGHSQKTFILLTGPLADIELALQIRSFSKSLFFSPSLTEIPDLQKFIDSISLASHPNDVFMENLLATDSKCLTFNLQLNSVVQQVLRYRLHECGNATHLRNLSSYLHLSDLFGTAHHVYKAVYAMAHALHEMQLFMSSIPRSNSLIHHKHKYKYFLRRVHFKDPTGEEVYFKEKRDMPSDYSIYHLDFSKISYKLITFGGFSTSNLTLVEFEKSKDYLKWKTGVSALKVTEEPLSQEITGAAFIVSSAQMEKYPVTQVKVIPGNDLVLGVVRTSLSVNYQKDLGMEKVSTFISVNRCFDKWLCINCPEDQWPNDDNRCAPKLVDFLSYENDPISNAVSIITSLCFVQSSIILSMFIIYRDTPIIKANNRNLSFLLLVSIMLSFLCVLLFIGRPGHVTCMARHTLYGITSSVTISSILAKTFMVYSAFRATKPGSSWRKCIGVKLTNCLVFICFFIQVLICSFWLVLSPPFPENNTKLYPDIIIIQCNEGSVLAFALLLGYMGLLAAVSFIVAFLARHLPNSFNEAKYITFSMLVFCSVWVTFIPAYLSATGKSTVLVEIFAIISSTVGILGCIFYPKCYIILLRPESNVKNVLLRQVH